MNLISCPLTPEKRQFDSVETLLQDCTSAKCHYATGDLEYDPPPGCVLLVAALLASAKKEVKQP